MRTMNSVHTHDRGDVSETVAHLTRHGHAPSVVWQRRGATAAAYLCTRQGDAFEVVARIDDVSDGDAAYDRARPTWAAVEAGASFRICPGGAGALSLRLPCGRPVSA